MFVRQTLLLSVLLAAPAWAAFPAWTEAAAIAAARAACPSQLKLEGWSATLNGDNWEARGVTADGKAAAVATYRKDRAKPLICAVLLQPFDSRYLRPL